jgi:hypothetical protein
MKLIMRCEAAAAVALIASLFASTLARGADDLVERTFRVGATTLAIDLPREAEIRPLAGSPGVVRVDFAPGRRQPRTVDLASGVGADPGGVGEATTRIGKDAVVTYRVEISGGGSGGDEGFLIGRLVLGAAVLSFTCVTQAEGLRQDDAKWCLEKLRHLRVTETSTR